MSESQRIHDLRVSEKLSRAEFGQLLGITPDQVGKLERGEREASRNVLTKIVNRFPGITIDFLLTGSTDKQINKENKSVIGSNAPELKTPLGRNLLKCINQLAVGIHAFDDIADNYSSLRALEGTASALSINNDTRKALKRVKNDLRSQAV